MGLKGVNNCNLSELGSTLTSTPLPSSAGGLYPLSSTPKPFGGNSNPVGSSNLTSSPLLFVSVSVSGLKSNLPAIAIAATISGDATKACVFGLPSALLEKFLLNECMILFFGAFIGSLYLAHCPIQGPQALVKMVALRSSNIFKIPSLSVVYLTCSLPGLIPNSALVVSPLSTACFAIDAALDKSS